MVTSSVVGAGDTEVTSSVVVGGDGVVTSSAVGEDVVVASSVAGGDVVVISSVEGGEKVELTSFVEGGGEVEVASSTVEVSTSSVVEKVGVPSADEDSQLRVSGKLSSAGEDCAMVGPVADDGVAGDSVAGSCGVWHADKNAMHKPAASKTCLAERMKNSFLLL